jgi:transcriptional regulator with XRE-family HTH domain
MGRSRRPRPSRLASKLLRIRLALGLTQQQMFERLSCLNSPLLLPHVSDFELDKREPSLAILLGYARMTGIALEIFADDELDLPARLERRARLNRAKEAMASGRCPYCGAVDKQIKAGRNRSGSNRYQCRHCLRHYTPRPTGGYRPNRVDLSGYSSLDSSVGRGLPGSTLDGLA